MSGPVEEPGDPEFAEDEYEESGDPSTDKVLELFTLLAESVARSERKLDRVIEWIEDMEDDLK